MQTAEKRTADPAATGPAVMEDPNRVGLLFAVEKVAQRLDRVHAGGMDPELEAVARLIAASVERGE